MTKLGKKLIEAVECTIAFNKVAEEVNVLRGSNFDISAMVGISSILIATLTPEEVEELLPDFGDPKPMFNGGEYSGYTIQGVVVVFKVKGIEEDTDNEDS